MVQLYVVPEWFFGFNIFLELIFFVITILLASFAFRVYRASLQKNLRTFGLVFASIAVSYILLACINLLFLSTFHPATRALSLDEITDLKNVAIGLYVVFFIIGFSGLFHATHKTPTRKMFLLVDIIAFLGVYLSTNKALFLYSMSSIFLAFTVYHYLKQYTKNKNKNELAVLLGMTFLLTSQLGLAAQSVSYHPNLYVVSNILELIGYSCILISLLNILNNGAKKKSA